MSNNNKTNFNCPAIMNDGRHVTDYRPSDDVYEMMIRQNNLKNSNDVRQFLTNNANKLMQRNTEFYTKLNSCDSCNFFQSDPNKHNDYWNNYKSNLKNRSIL